LNIYNLILGLLLADIAINLHKSSECKVPHSFKDFVDTATTTSGAGAAAFTAFLAVLCLMAIMSLAEEYKSLSSRIEEDKGNRLLLNQYLIPTVAASVMPPVAVALAFVEGGDFTGALYFNIAFMIPFLYSLLPIILYRSVWQYQLQDLALPSTSSFVQVLLGAGTLCALGKEIIQDISWLPNLTG
jgi:Mn2+/Fe2+ NRAMP family transporter